MRTFAGFLLSLVGLFLLYPPAHAQTERTAGQERPGAITGKVTDSGGAVLQSAKVKVEPGPIDALSDAQGQFLISGLAPGTYTVTIRYVGFNTFTKSVMVSAAQVANVNAQLGVASQNLEVLVTAERASGEAEEVNRQRNADNVVQVLTSDVIRSLPNANMADALGRLPSVTIERDEGALPTPPLTASTFLHRNPVFGRSNSTPFPPTSSSPSKSTRPCRPTWMAMASAAPLIWSPRLRENGPP